jgi:hypothetical protein
MDRFVECRQGRRGFVQRLAGGMATCGNASAVPDTPVEPTPGGRYPADMESRVPVPQQIARTTVAARERIERRFDAGDTATALIGVSTDLPRSISRDFRWLPGTMPGGCGAVLGAMARGFRWPSVSTRSGRA